jgi:predicted metal-dependent enzyme (double-stranded beta helix superfamily)
MDSATLRAFIEDITTVVRHASSPPDAVVTLRPAFSRLLNDRLWLPDRFRAPCESGGMGGGIGQWLLYRSADRSLTLFSLVVPPGSATPVHDHLAWGLVGLYEGTQEETIYRLVGSHGEGHSELEPTAVRQLQVGDFYDLIPPDNDIHSVRTTSPTPSVSLHLLARDIGCTWRHAYDPNRQTVRPFRSGYTNAECEDGPPASGAS